MKRWLWVAIGVLAGIAVVSALAWLGTKHGWLGKEREAGTVNAQAVPADIVAARITSDQAGGADEDVILFGDLHVHTTYSTDAFQWALPMMGGRGAHPLADACDFARFCSALDFWAITDHAEAGTPVRWQRAKQSIRQCQAVAGQSAQPDLISFVGFEWTQVGRLPDEHYGHQNVIFRDLEDQRIAARPIAASGIVTQVLRTQATGVPPGVVLKDFPNRAVYFDFNTFIRKVQQVPDCDPAVPSGKLPPNCYEQAATPGELARRLADQGLDPLIIPHGTTWGLYTPPGSSLDKALEPAQHPEKLRLIEIFSGHGNSEEYRSWSEVIANPDGVTAQCPTPTANYTPSCWRAGEIIRERCMMEKLGAQECERRVIQARSDYANMGTAGHLAIPGAEAADWLDAGQCTDCYLPAFNYRPRKSVQYGLAISRFTPESLDPAGRFRWGFIASSDNHRARPGTGYKQVDRRLNTESSGPASEEWRRLTMGEPVAKEARSKPIERDRLMRMSGFQLTELERQASFFMTGGLAVVHARERSREAIWEALQARRTYATSGPRILLWFKAVDPATGAATPMGGAITTDRSPQFEVRAVGSFKQKPGCPDFSKAGVDEARLATLCSGECFNPSDERKLITRIEVVRIRPQIRPDEPVDNLIEDKFIVHQCKPDPNGCSLRFTDPGYGTGKRNALYYVRAIQEAEPVINADNVRCVRDSAGKCIQVRLCYGDYRSGQSDCTAPAEPRAWSSPIYLDQPRARGG